METSLLKKIGYKIENRLSTIKRNIPDAEFNAQRDKRSLLPIAAINLSLQELTEPLERRDRDGLPNPFRLGYEYAKQGIDPTIYEIWEGLAGDPKYEGIQRWVSTWEQAAANSELCVSVAAEFSTYIGDVLIGYKTFSAIPPLKRKWAIIERSKEFFTSRQAQTKDFNRLIEVVDWLMSKDFTLEDSIGQVVEKRRLVEAMKAALEQTKTPDILRTIEDQVETIKAKVAKQKDALQWFENPYHDGYYMAIRGEDKLMVDVVEAIFFKGTSGVPGFLSDHVQSNSAGDVLSAWVNTILEGYAASYHLVYLQQRLAATTQQAEYAGSKATAKHDAPKLKWKGQKNQLYEVLRKLKEKEWLDNSYEELAVFVKTHVDVFSNTALSTINKEMGRPQNLPKSRRIDLDQ